MSLWTSIVNAAGKLFGKAEDIVGEPLIPILNPYCHEVVPGVIWRGSWPNEATILQLKAKDIHSIVNLCKERSQDKLVWKCNLFSFNIPILDNSVPDDGQCQVFHEIASVYSPLYVHCEEGVGRTGCIIAEYRVRMQGWTPERALGEAVSFGMAMPDQKAWILQLKPNYKDLGI